MTSLPQYAIGSVWALMGRSMEGSMAQHDEIWWQSKTKNVQISRKKDNVLVIRSGPTAAFYTKEEAIAAAKAILKHFGET